MAHPPMPELLAVAGPSYSKGMQSLSCAQRSSSGQFGAAARAAAFARAQRVAFRDACQLWSFFIVPATEAVGSWRRASRRAQASGRSLRGESPNARSSGNSRRPIVRHQALRSTEISWAARRFASHAAQYAPAGAARDALATTAPDYFAYDWNLNTQ